MPFLVNIGHEQLLPFIIIRYKGDGTARDIGVVLDNLPTVVSHTVWLVQMALHVEIDIIGRLLYAHQNVVNMLYGTLQLLFGILESLFFQRLAREVEKNRQRQKEQQYDFAYHYQIESDGRVGEVYLKQLQHGLPFLLFTLLLLLFSHYDGY